MERNLKIWIVPRNQARVMKSADFSSPSLLDKRCRLSFLERLDVSEPDAIFRAVRKRGAADYDVVVYCASFLLSIGNSAKTTVIRMRPGESGAPLTERQVAIVESARRVIDESG